MRILLVNLKHLYQRRLLWVVYIYLAIMALWVSPDASWQRELELVWGLALTAGVLVGMMASELLAKAFFWCMPGHQPVVRKVVFIIGLAMGVWAVVCVTRQRGVPSFHLSGALVPAFYGSVTAYFSGVAATLLAPRRDMILVGWPTLLAWIIIVSGGILAGLSRLEVMVIGYPLLIVLIGSVVGFGLWAQIGRRAWGRQFCAAGWCFSPSMHRQGYARLSQRPVEAQGIEAKVESFFLRRMKAGMHEDRVRFIWGTLYTTYGPFALWWKPCVALLLAVTTAAACAGPAAAWVFAGLSLMIVPSSWLPFRSVLLLPAGRRERFAAAMALAAATAGIVALFIIVLAILSVPLSVLIPQIEVWDLLLACRRIPLRTVWVPLLIVPLIATPRVLFPKMWFPLDLLIIGMAQMAFMTVLVALASLAPFVLMDVLLGVSKAISSVRPATAIAVAIVLAWVFFGLACAYAARKRSVIRS